MSPLTSFFSHFLFQLLYILLLHCTSFKYFNSFWYHNRGFKWWWLSCVQTWKNVNQNIHFPYLLILFWDLWNHGVRVTMFGTTQMKRFLTKVVGTFYASTFLFLTYWMWMSVSANDKKVSLKQSPILGLRISLSPKFPVSHPPLYSYKKVQFPE